ncbi:MAG TPA: class I SAM-dependent methyltransferase [Candidatus Magasanikbacteria bacterium]|nr:class I SAM-dependent methyltransferase [Candidatus Magasanikbacteria bacterium]
MALKPAQIIRNITRNYNTIAKDWDVSRYQPSPIKIQILKAAKKGMVVGDIGCGNGVVIPELLHRGIKKYYGLDISSKLIAIAAKKYKEDIKKGKVEFKVGDALKIPYSKNKFDLVISFAAMHHLPGRENHLKFLTEVKRILKPGGKAIILNWNLLNDKVEKRFNIKESMEVCLKNGYDERDVYVGWKATPGKNVMRFIHVFTKDEMKQLVKQVGFSKFKIENYNQLGKKEKNGEEQATILQK